MSPKISEQQKEQRRLELLKAAKSVFIKNGYEKTTMKHVMDQAGVSRGGLYLYFSNKEDLFEAILNEEMKENIDEIHHLLDSKKSYWVLLKQLLEGDKEEPESPPEERLAPVTLEFFMTGRKQQMRLDYAMERYKSAHLIFRPIIEKGIEQGEFSPTEDIDTIINTIISFNDGLNISNLILSGQLLIPEKQIDIFLKYLHYILQVKATN